MIRNALTEKVVNNILVETNPKNWHGHGGAPVDFVGLDSCRNGKNRAAPVQRDLQVHTHDVQLSLNFNENELLWSYQCRAEPLPFSGPGGCGESGVNGGCIGNRKSRRPIALSKLQTGEQVHSHHRTSILACHIGPDPQESSWSSRFAGGSRVLYSIIKLLSTNVSLVVPRTKFSRVARFYPLF